MKPVQLYPTAAAMILLAGSLLCAQTPPALQSVSPDIAVAGKTIEAVATGSFAGATRAVIHGEGGVTVEILPPVQGQPANQLKLKLTTSADAPRGPREIRIVTPAGVTNPIGIGVDDYPAIAEVEPNNSSAQAQAIVLPGIISGAIQAGQDMDSFKFTAKKGQRLIFDVVAARLGSALDSSLALVDFTGRTVARDEDTNGADSLLDYTVPADGAYTLKIHDLRYQGGGNFFYRIRAGEIPYVDAFFPMGAKRGSSIDVELIGRNLPMTRWPLVLDANWNTGLRPLAAPTNRGFTNFRSFAVSDLAEFIEREPNDTPAAANVVMLPLVINGRMDKPGDLDSFSFKVPTNQPIVAEVFAQRLGSRLDSLLTLSDASGNVMQRIDDSAGADAKIQFQEANKDRELVLTISNVLGRGGPDTGYRLVVSPVMAESPDFEVVFQGETPRVARGSNTKLWCQVKRKGGFAGDVTVSIPGLPNGVTATPLTLKANEPSSGIIILSASADAPVGFYPLSLSAAGKQADKSISHSIPARGLVRTSPQVLLTVLDAAPFAVASNDDPAFKPDPAKLAADLAAAELSYREITPAFAAALAKWESLNSAQVVWQPLESITMKADAGTVLTPLPDGGIRAEGPKPDRDNYTIVGKTNLKGITAIKLEAIAADGKGPGRADDGNYVLSRFLVSAAPTAKEKEKKSVELINPVADFNQASFPITNTLSANPNPGSGWAVSPQVTQSHWGVWHTKSPVGVDGGTTLTFQIIHEFSGQRFTFRHFRILVSTVPKPAGGFSPPSSLLAALATPAPMRTPAQRDAIAEHYRSTAAEYAPMRDKLALLRALSQTEPITLVGNLKSNLVVNVKRNGYAGDITLNLEGYNAGIEPDNQPSPIAKSLTTAPIVLKAGQSQALIPIESSALTERASRTVVVRADATVNGQVYTQYSRVIPLVVKDAPAAPQAPAAKPAK